jgi:diguanylate cyclase (GGDEF)-like protein
MMQDSKPSIAKLSDHEVFQQSILELDRSLKKSLRSSSVEILTLLGAIVFPFFLMDHTSIHQLETIVAVDVLLLLILVSRGLELRRHRGTRLILAKQLNIAAKQRARTDQLYGLSILDPLTGLHNRRFGEQRLTEEIARSERSPEPLAVILFDLDYFKEINDKFGHAVGDLALKAFSRRLRRAIRACDVPIRMGGDEFLLVLPECPRDKVDIILSRIGTPEIEASGQKISVRYSTGRAHYQYTDTTEVLLERADEALYAQKAARAANLNPPTNVAESKPKIESAKASLPDRHALKVAESDWGRP